MAVKHVKLILLVIALLLLALVVLKVGAPKDLSMVRITPTPEQKDQWDWASATKPEWGRLYLTADKNESGIYYTNEHLVGTSKNSSRELGPYTGIFIGFDSDRVDTGLFHFLKDPTPITHDMYVNSIDQLIASPSNNFVYLLLNSSAEVGLTPEVALYRVDLGDLSTQKMWTSTFANGTREREGVVRIDDVVGDKYIVLTVYSCFECEGGIEGELIVNAESGFEKYIADVFELSVDLDSETLSYLKLQLVKADCDSNNNPWCSEDGTVEVKQPSGEVVTEPLP